MEKVNEFPEYKQQCKLPKIFKVKNFNLTKNSITTRKKTNSNIKKCTEKNKYYFTTSVI